MKTKEILADMIAGTFDVEACANALKVDARTLIKARNAQTNEAKKSCWTEQTGRQVRFRSCEVSGALHQEQHRARVCQ